MLFACLLFAVPAVQSSRADEDGTSYRPRLLELHNAARAEQKAAPLVHNDLLAKAAQAHAQHMAKTGKFAHDGIGDGTIPQRIDAAGYKWSRAGENIAWSGQGTQDDTRAVMDIWLKSPAHRMQLLSDYREVGFGRAAATGGKVYWVACFGNPE